MHRARDELLLHAHLASLPAMSLSMVSHSPSSPPLSKMRPPKLHNAHETSTGACSGCR